MEVIPGKEVERRQPRLEAGAFISRTEVAGILYCSRVRI
jgi:hypothetical protein